MKKKLLIILLIITLINILCLVCRIATTLLDSTISIDFEYALFLIFKANLIPPVLLFLQILCLLLIFDSLKKQKRTMIILFVIITLIITFFIPMQMDITEQEIPESQINHKVFRAPDIIIITTYKNLYGITIHTKEGKINSFMRPIP